MNLQTQSATTFIERSGTTISATGFALARNGLRGDVERVVEGALDITAYGGSPANPDNGAALAAALNASSGGGGCVSFPPGRFTARCAP